VVRAADALTLGRALAALPVAVLVSRHQDRLAALLFAAGGISDLLDGPIARRSGGTVLGQQLDPLADKLLTDTALLALAARGHAPWELVMTLVARDVTVSALRTGNGAALTPTPPARWKTGLLYLCVTGLLASPPGSLTHRAAHFGVAVATGMALVSGWDYVRRR
jgi:CDP-diacylglycerol--glycerol-3-phosphate 3-phosphatidyltransferase